MARTRPTDRLDELVRTATETFLRNGGPDRTQMVDVARALGVAKGTLYLYVEGKEALLDLVLQHADQSLPVAPPHLPVPNPPPGGFEARVEARIRSQGSFPQLDRALAAKHLDAAAISRPLAEVYDVLVRNRTAIRLINLAARARPELAALWFEGARGPLLAGLRALIQRGADQGVLTAPPNTEAAARVVVETCMWFAVHRSWDPSPDGVPDAQIRATVLHMLARGVGLPT